MATYTSGQRGEVLEKLRSGGTFRDDTLRQLTLDRQDLSGLSMISGRIERCSLGAAILEGGRFDACRITNTSLRQVAADHTAWVDARARLSDLAAASLRGACFNACRFEETLMAGMDFEGATLTDCEFDICDMTGASFKDGLLVRCRFRDNRLGSANLMNTCFDGAQLVDVDLRDANLQYASLKGALLVRVHLQGANLQSAALDGATFVEVKGLPDDVRDRMATERRGAVRQGRAIARAVDIDLDHGLEQMSHERLVLVARELLRTYVVEASVALLSEDPAAALLRQRSLRFADLIRFVKENFPHDEFKQILVEGDAVYVRTPAGDIPLTTYGNSPVRVSNPAPAPAPPSYARSGSERDAASPLPPPDLPPGMPRQDRGPSQGTAPEQSDTSRRSAPGPSRPAESPPDQRHERQEPDSFEPDRWGMIDL